MAEAEKRMSMYAQGQAQRERTEEGGNTDTRTDREHE